MSDYCPNCESSAKRIAELEAENEKLKWKQEYAAGVTGCFFGLTEALAAERAALKGRRCHGCYHHTLNSACGVYDAGWATFGVVPFNCCCWEARP